MVTSKQKSEAKTKVKKAKKGFIVWEKPSGIKVETNDEFFNVDAAQSLGWTRVGE
jgi:hypothetical protein